MRIFAPCGHYISVGKFPREINNRFDRVMKAFADEAPRLLLDVLGVVPKDARAEVTPLRPETAPPAVFPDYVAALRVQGSDAVFLFHAEFQVKGTIAEIVYRMTKYGGGLAWEYEVEVMSFLLLLRPGGVPGKIPKVARRKIFRTTMAHEFKTVRMWELDPGAILETGDPKLFPWAVLMKSTDEQVRKIGEILGRDGDEESIFRFLTLGSLKYDRNWLEETVGGARVGIVEAIMEGSSLVKGITEKATERATVQGLEKGLAQGLEKGLAQGLEKGRVEGRAEGRVEGEVNGRLAEARRLLRSALAAKYPGLEALPEIDSVTNVEVLEDLLIGHVIPGSDPASIEQAIRAAAN